MRYWLVFGSNRGRLARILEILIMCNLVNKYGFYPECLIQLWDYLLLFYFFPLWACTLYNIILYVGYAWDAVFNTLESTYTAAQLSTQNKKRDGKLFLVHDIELIVQLELLIMLMATSWRHKLISEIIHHELLTLFMPRSKTENYFIIKNATT